MPKKSWAEFFRDLNEGSAQCPDCTGKRQGKWRPSTVPFPSDDPWWCKPHAIIRARELHALGVYDTSAYTSKKIAFVEALPIRKKDVQDAIESIKSVRTSG